MLRPVHMASRHRHHLLQNLNGILGNATQADGKDLVHSACMTFIANKMSPRTSCFTALLFVAQLTFHPFVRIQISQGCFTNQTFLVHSYHLVKIHLIALRKNVESRCAARLCGIFNQICHSKYSNQHFGCNLIPFILHTVRSFRSHAKIVSRTGGFLRSFSL